MTVSAKRAGLVSAVSLSFLLICSAVAYLLRFSGIKEAAVSLYIGLGILAAAGVLVLLAGKLPILNIPVYFISAVAFGFCIRAWYIFRGFDNSPLIMLAVCACATLYLWAFWLLSKIPIFRENPTVFICIYLLLSVAAYLWLVFGTVTTYVSTLGYYALIEMAFIYALYTDCDSWQDTCRSFALSTFSVFSAVAFAAGLIAVAVLGGDCDADCDMCECIECCDLPSGDGFGIKRKKK